MDTPLTKQSEETITLVRKVIKTKKLTVITKYPPQDEIECLELYHSLQHANIIPFLGSYTLGDQHFLLFPFYPMDLNTFMRQEVPFGEFGDMSIFTAALVGLASALQSVHELNRRCNLTPAFLTTYGYHHDIRPANILVTEKSFVLADFGLARPTLPDQECSTIWIKNIGHYVAPECMTPELKPQQVGRSYDIWAFGCLLTELATYMEQGANGVSEFRSQRITPYFHDLPFINGYFFQGNSLKDEVTRWLTNLSREPRFRVTFSLVAFSMHILQDDQCRRPDIGICVTCLSYIHAKQSFHTACLLLDELLSTLSHPQYSKVVSAHTMTELQMELSKLKAFGAVLQMENDAVFDSELFSNQMFAKLVTDCLILICGKLRQSRDTLRDHKKAWLISQSHLGSIGQSMVHIINESFRQQVRELCESLPPPEQQYLDSLWRKYLFDDCKRKSSLEAVQYSVNTMPQLFTPIALHMKIERLEQALRRQIDVTNSIDRNLILDRSEVQSVRSFGRSHSLGVYKRSQVQVGVDFTFAQPRQERVLIEWIFISQISEEESPDERIGKILILAGLLNCSKPTSFRVLDCAGVIPPNKIDDPRYGFVYTFPPEVNAEDSREPFTLRQLLLDDTLRISLDDKFKISKVLSSSVFELHCHGWLHKNITSDNIIFFLQNKENNKGHASSCILDAGPYLIGFHHSRPESEIFYSDINSAENNIGNLFYQHPKYEYGTNRFKKVDDYYSLGIVLLEIAFWKTCHDIWQSGRYKSLDRDAFKEKLVEKFVPGLAAVMGTAYRDAVSICLHWEFNADDNERTFSQDTDSHFFRQVVQKLGACHVG